MSPLFSKRDTYPGDPYAEAKALKQREARKDSYYLLYEIQSGQQGDDDTYGRLKKLQQEASA